MLPSDYLPDARRDFEESLDWYFERSAATAERFIFAMETGLTRVAKQPEVFSFVDKIHQACPLKRFPFRIVFRVLQDRILIVAIAHAKRRPSFWSRRK